MQLPCFYSLFPDSLNHIITTRSMGLHRKIVSVCVLKEYYEINLYRLLYNPNRKCESEKRKHVSCRHRSIAAVVVNIVPLFFLQFKHTSYKQHVCCLFSWRCQPSMYSPSSLVVPKTSPWCDPPPEVPPAQD